MSAHAAPSTADMDAPAAKKQCTAAKKQCTAAGFLPPTFVAGFHDEAACRAMRYRELRPGVFVSVVSLTRPVSPYSTIRPGSSKSTTSRTARGWGA